MTGIGFCEKMTFELKLDKDEGANHGDICREKVPTSSRIYKDGKETHVGSTD